MKTVEEKAKAYDEAVERAKKVFNREANDREPGTSICEYIFPELAAESYDEKVRKALIDLVKCNERSGYKLLNNIPTSSMLAWLEKQKPVQNINKEDEEVRQYIVRIMEQRDINVPMVRKALAWLEKHGEQKPTLRERYKNIAESEWFKKTHDGMSVSDDEKVDNVNKVEPKFKVGNFIKHNRLNVIHEIISFNGDHYFVRNAKTGNIIKLCNAERNFHLWTIQDAKDGDVLIDKSNVRECPFVFKATKPSNIKTDIPNPLVVLGYCGIGGAGFTKGSGWGDTANCIYYPAAKEQRDLLFAKMKEAGYEWDADKKELKKADVELTDFEKSLKHIMIETLECGDTHNLKADAEMLLRFAQKPAWSEEDAEILSMLIELVEHKEESMEVKVELITWLKSLKQKTNGIFKRYVGV